MARTANDRRNVYRNYGLVLLAVALVITIAAGWFASSPTVETLDASKLQQKTSDLESYAAESGLLANQYEHGRATDNFTATAATKLHESVSTLADQIEEQPVKPGAADQAKKIVDKADDLDDQLTALLRLPGHEKAGSITGQIEDIREDLEAMQ